MPLPKGFDPVPGPEAPRFSERPVPDGRPARGDFARDDKTAESARAAHDALVAQLRAKQITVTGDFRPEQFPSHDVAGGLESIELSGGPFDGQMFQVRRGAPEYARPAANPDPAGIAFVPAAYARTRKLSNAGFVLFEFKQPVTTA